MTFAAPDWLFALVLVPAFWAWAALRARGGPGEGGGGASARWLWVDGSRVRPAAESRARRRFGMWASAGLALGIVALAQPQWGEGEVVRFDQGREVLIALDLSRSMLAEDVAPSRLGRARLLIESTLERLRGERVGLLLFAGTAFLQSPLSADHEVLRELLPMLEPGYLPQGGTDFASMIDASLEAFSQTGAADRYLVILSDGESPNFEPDAVDALVEAGVRVVALGIGTEAGALIPDGRGGIVKDDRGAAVLSRLERPVLEGLARGTNGVYADAAQWVDLASLVERTVGEGQEGRFVEERERARIHRFQWWLAPALALLLLSHLFEVPAAPRSRRLHEAVSTRPRGDGARARAAAAALLALGALAVAQPASASPGIGDETPPGAAGEAPPEDPIVAVVERLSGAPALGAIDYAELAQTTTTVGLARREAGEPLPGGAIQDALAAVEAGRALDAEAAEWDDLRAALELLDRPPPPSPEQQQEEAGGESGESGESQQDGQSGQSGGQAGSESESGESGEQGDATSAPQPGESSPQNARGGEGDRSQTGDASDEGAQPSSGERERGDPQAMESASAGFGDLEDEPESGDEGRDEGEASGSSQEGDEGEGEDRPAPPSRMVGGTRGANEELVQSRPDLATTVGRMERVREGDAPALLFDRMNRAEGRATERPADGGRDW